MLDGYLTADQAAKHLGISKRTLYNLASNNPTFPPAQYVGRTPLWRPEVLDEWRAQHPARAKPEAKKDESQ